MGKVIKAFLNGLTEGMGSVFDPLGRDEPEDLELEFYRDDTEALRSDWEAVGRDMYAAMGQFAEENNLEREKTK